MHDEPRRNILELILIGVLLSAFVASAIYTLQYESEQASEIELLSPQ